MPRNLFRVLVVFTIATVALVMVFQFAEQRMETSALPRYCDDLPAHLGYVRKILTEPEPAGDGPRRPYIIAAKLIYLVPKRPEEDIEAYLTRLDKRVGAICP